MLKSCIPKKNYGHRLIFYLNLVLCQCTAQAKQRLQGILMQTA